MSQTDESVRDHQEPQSRDVLERAVLPVAIPLVAIVVVEIVVFAFSRVLLTAGKTPAVVIGTLAALAILLGAAAIAAAPRIRPSTIQGLLVLVLLATVGAGGWAFARGPAPIEGHEEGGHADEAGVAIVAANIQFDTDRLEVPAGKPFTISFHNADAGVPHNVAIYTDDSASDALFVGDIFNGDETRDYEVPAVDAGEYFFHCDVHPAMNGTVVAE